jgi:hypothetical protein
MVILSRSLAPEVVHNPPQISHVVHRLCTILAAISLFLHAGFVHDKTSER